MFPAARGARQQGLKEAAGSALRSLLKITSRCKGGKGEMPPDDTVYYDCLGYFLALIPLSTTPEGFKKLLEDANTTPELPKEPRGAEARDLPEMSLTLLGICDSTAALLSTAFISSVLTTVGVGAFCLTSRRGLITVPIGTRTCTRGPSTYSQTARTRTL